MRQSIEASLARTTRQLRLDTLVRLRWLAVAGQLASVGIVDFWLRFDLPVMACLVIIGFSAALNLWLGRRFPRNLRLTDDRAAWFLAYDILQLAALLFLTGGLQNPFALLLLAPVMISATALPPRYTLALGGLAAATATVLVIWAYPLPTADGKGLELPDYVKFGHWVGILAGLGFSAIYTWRVAEEARDLSRALAATEIVLAREQHLSQLDGLAAAAAHELGTPLSTIALIVKELSRTLPPGTAAGDDIVLLQQQVARCSQILGTLSSWEKDEGAPFLTLSLSELLEELAAPHRPLSVPVTVRLRGEGPEPRCRRNPAMLHGLANLADNAADFAQASLIMEASWDDRSVAITITDDGPGFPAEVLARAGDPYLSRRQGAHAGLLGSGLGLGLFIAKTLLERGGAALHIANRALPESGAVARVVWPRTSFEGAASTAGSDSDPNPPGAVIGSKGTVRSDQ